MELIFLILLSFGFLSFWLLWFWSWLVSFLVTLFAWRDPKSCLFIRLCVWISGVLLLLPIVQHYHHQLALSISCVVFVLSKSGLIYPQLKSVARFVIMICALTMSSSLIRSIMNNGTTFFEEWFIEYATYAGDWGSNSGIIFGTLTAMLYAPYYYDGAEHDGSRNWKWFRSLRVWRLIHAYFGLDFEFKDKTKTLNLMEKGPVMYAMHPHGLWNVSGPFGAGLHAGKIDFDILIGATSIVFWIPFYRDATLWAGGVDVSRRTLNMLLKQKKTIGLAPGGVQEIVLSNVDQLNLYLEHEGFLKLCWDHKSPVIPTFCRGENRIFLILDILHAFRKSCCHLIGYPLPTIFLGPWMTDLRIFIGEPIIPDLTDETFELFKNKYYTELFSLIRDNETHEISQQLNDSMRGVLKKEK